MKFKRGQIVLDQVTGIKYVVTGTPDTTFVLTIHGKTVPSYGLAATDGSAKVQYHDVAEVESVCAAYEGP